MSSFVMFLGVLLVSVRIVGFTDLLVVPLFISFYWFRLPLMISMFRDPLSYLLWEFGLCSSLGIPFVMCVQSLPILYGWVPVSSLFLWLGLVFAIAHS